MTVDGRPVKLGLRFSRKEEMPSFASGFLTRRYTT